MRRQKRSYSRFDFGSNLVEMPLAIFIIMVCLALPLLILVTMTIRVAFFWNATRECVKAASECTTFENNAGTEEKSALVKATEVTTRALNAFHGIALDKVELFIVSTPADTGGIGVPSILPANTKLPAPADPEHNVYEVRAEVSGVVEPLTTMSSSFFGDIPGLTQPFPIKMSSQRVVESPQSWNY